MQSLTIQQWVAVEPFAGLAVVELVAFGAWFAVDIGMDLWSYGERPFDHPCGKLDNVG